MEEKKKMMNVKTMTKDKELTTKWGRKERRRRKRKEKKKMMMMMVKVERRTREVRRGPFG
jgi:hypothetical protein